MKTKLFLFTCLLAVLGCRKEGTPEKVTAPPPVIELYPAFSYSVDSSCINFPNVFTPNGDGVNDIFSTYGINIATFNITIYNSANQLVFTSGSLNNSWNGYQNTASGTGIFDGVYRFVLVATTISNQNISGQKYFHLVTDITAQCFTNFPPALFGDMMDARYCAPIYITLENVCYE